MRQHSIKYLQFFFNFKCTYIDIHFPFILFLDCFFLISILREKYILSINEVIIIIYQLWATKQLVNINPIVHIIGGHDDVLLFVGSCTSLPNMLGFS
jgi:hypothetical protein